MNSVRGSLLVLLLLTFGVVALPACSAFRSACDKALPVLSQGNALSTEAGASLDQVQALVDGLDVSADAKAYAQAKIEQARAALRGSAVTFASLSEVCSAPDVVGVLAPFVRAWNELKPIVVGLISSAKPRAGAAPLPATFPIDDPMIVKRSLPNS